MKFLVGLGRKLQMLTNSVNSETGRDSMKILKLVSKSSNLRLGGNMQFFSNVKIFATLKMSLYA